MTYGIDAIGKDGVLNTLTEMFFVFPKMSRLRRNLRLVA